MRPQVLVAHSWEPTFVPLPHQSAAIRFVAGVDAEWPPRYPPQQYPKGKGKGGILADGMGVGKTSAPSPTPAPHTSHRPQPQPQPQPLPRTSPPPPSLIHPQSRASEGSSCGRYSRCTTTCPSNGAPRSSSRPTNRCAAPARHSSPRHAAPRRTPPHPALPRRTPPRFAMPRTPARHSVSDSWEVPPLTELTLPAWLTHSTVR